MQEANLAIHEAKNVVHQVEGRRVGPLLEATRPSLQRRPARSSDVIVLEVLPERPGAMRIGLPRLRVQRRKAALVDLHDLVHVVTATEATELQCLPPLSKMVL